MLVGAEPGEFVVEDFAVGLAEVAVFDAPVGDGAGDAVDELFDGGFALAGVLLAVKILRDDDLGGELRPGLGHFDVFLFEDDFAGVIGDLGGATVPFDLVEGLDLGVAEDALDAEGFGFGLGFGWSLGRAGGTFGGAGGGEHGGGAPATGGGRDGAELFLGVDHGI